ncbi:MAG: hypothetical protein JKY14_03690, partial [Paraglaciecola sp.]|nr:hypothetical protein [Paraglaciecola sp.]
PQGSPYFAQHVLIDVPKEKQPKVLLQQSALTVRYLPQLFTDDTYCAITIYLDTNVNSLGEDFNYLNPLFVRRLKVKLETVLNAAEQAGIDVGIETTRHGLKLAISGRGGNWTKLIADLLYLIPQAKLNIKQVKESRQSHIRTLQQQGKTRIRKQTQKLLDSRLGLRVSTNDSLAYFNSFDENRYQRFSQNYLNSAHLSAFYYGHLAVQDYEEMNKSLRTLSTRITQPISPAIERWGGSKIQPMQTQNVLLVADDSAVRLVLMPIESSMFSAASIELLGAMSKAPFFHQLRTQEQLGYSVSTSAKVRYGQPMLSYYVQSPVATSEQLLTRIERFNQWYLTYLTHMPIDQFEQVKQHLVMALQQPKVNSASAEAQMRYNFRYGRSIDYEQQLQKMIEAMPKAELLRFASKLLNQPLYGVLVDPIAEEH